MLQHQTLMRLSSAAAAAGPASHASNSPATCAPAVVVEKRKREEERGQGEGKEQEAARKRRISSPLWRRTEKASAFSALPSSPSVFAGTAQVKGNAWKDHIRCHKGGFRQFNLAVCCNLTASVKHELFRVNQTHKFTSRLTLYKPFVSVAAFGKRRAV